MSYLKKFTMLITASITASIIFATLGGFIGSQIFFGPNLGRGVIFGMAAGFPIGVISGFIYSILVWLNANHFEIFKNRTSILATSCQGSIFGALASTWAWVPPLIKHYIFIYNCALCSKQTFLGVITSPYIKVNIIYIAPAAICGAICYKKMRKALTFVQPN